MREESEGGTVKECGFHGGKQHREMIGDLVQVVEMLKVAGIDQPLYCTDGVVISMALGDEVVGRDPTTNRTARRADALLGDNFPCPSSLVVVEVGRYNPDTWPRQQPVLHIGFNGRCSLINPKGHWFEAALLENAQEWYSVYA